jgi:putative multiple sugar transport system permease protein
VAILMRSPQEGGWGVPWWLAIFAGLAIGIVIGMWQGFWMSKMGIPGFIVTLAGYMFFRGLNQFIGKSNTIPVPEEFQYFGAGYLPEWGPDLGCNNSTLVLGALGIAFIAGQQLSNRRKQLQIGEEPPPLWTVVVRILLLATVIGYLTFLFATGRPGTSFPVSGIILLVLVGVYSFISERTPMGRNVYAVGGNKLAAELSGVSKNRVYFLVMVNMSFLAALAGMVFAGRATASGPNDGVGWELDAIAAVFIGGAAVSGGSGPDVGTMLGGLDIAGLNNGLQLLGVGTDATQMIKGLVLLLAVLLDALSKMQGGTPLLSRRRPAAKAAKA